MTDHTPLTVQRLNEIEARVNAAEDGWHIVVDEANPHRHEIHGDGPTHVAVFGGEWDDAFASYPVEANAEFAAHARADVPALLAEVRRLREAMDQIRHLHKDSPMGPCPVCINGDAGPDEDPTVPYPCPTARLAGAQDCDPPSAQPAEACGKCRQPFDPADTSFDGRARYHLTPYCRGCVDRCHDTEIADHRCVICA